MSLRHLLHKLIPLLLASLSLAAIPRRAPAQTAWTVCQFNTFASFVNVGVLGTDSTQEILRHEEIHRRQMADTIRAHGACVWLNQYQTLALEAEAYCASDSVRVRVKQTPVFEVSAISLGRLLGQFYPTISADSIVATWKRVCP